MELHERPFFVNDDRLNRRCICSCPCSLVHTVAFSGANMEKPEKLKPVTAEGRNGRVLVKFADEHGKEFAIDLSIFDVSMLISALYAASSKALKQPPSNKSKVRLPLD